MITTLTAITYFSAIIIVWIATMAMRRAGRIIPYLSVWMTGISFAVLASVYFFQLLFTFWHFIFASLLFVCFSWLVVHIIMRTRH